MISRCPHGVYSPAGEGQPSEYCSGCNVPEAPIGSTIGAWSFEAALVTGGWIYVGHQPIMLDSLPDGEAGEDDPTAACPRCGVLMVVKDEYDLNCGNCGFNDL